MDEELICGWEMDRRDGRPVLCGKPAKAQTAVNAAGCRSGLVCGVHVRSVRALEYEVTDLPSPDVRVGQVWADNDPRSKGRTLRVDAVADGTARCTVLTNSDDVQHQLDSTPGYRGQDVRGKTVRVRLDRFRPASTGYRLVQDGEG